MLSKNHGKIMNFAGNAVSRRTWLISLAVTSPAFADGRPRAGPGGRVHGPYRKTHQPGNLYQGY